MYTVHIRN